MHLKVLSAQARSLGLSINFSYSNLKEMKVFNIDQDLQTILANTNTKIFSTTKEDEETVKLLEKYKSEVSKDSIISMRAKEIYINIKR